MLTCAIYCRQRIMSEECLALLLRCLGILDLTSYMVLWLRSESTLGVAWLEGPKFRGYTP